MTAAARPASGTMPAEEPAAVRPANDAPGVPRPVTPDELPFVRALAALLLADLDRHPPQPPQE